MLFLVGLGLGKDDLSLSAMDTIRHCDLLFVESYTATLPSGYLERVEAQAGKKAEALVRGDLEERAKETVALAKDKNIVILVPGDPLIATTHGILLNEARGQGIQARVVHAPSVFSVVIGESGLDVYKFGPTATIPFWHDNYRPVSFLDLIGRNLEAGQHTLALLDLEQKTARPMRSGEAKQIVVDALRANPKSSITAGTRILLIANAARDDARTLCISIGELDSDAARQQDGKLLTIVFPGKTSFAEEESLSRICAPSDPST